MPKQIAISDNSYSRANLHHSGTAENADTIRSTGEASGATHVHITGTSVDIGGGGGGGTQHNEDDAHSSGAGGNLIFGVRQDVQADFGQDGDYTPLSIDADGLLRTSASGGEVGGGTLDTIGTLGSIQNVGQVHNAGTIKNLDKGTITALAKGTISAGTITGLLQTEDTGHSTGDLGVMGLAVRVDGGTSLVGLDLEYAPLQVDAVGALRIAGTVVSTAGEVGGGTLDTIGTLGSIGNVGVIHNAGTVGSVTGIGTITNLGSVTDMGTVKEVANLAGGTVQIDSLAPRAVIRYGTLGTSGAEVRGTLVSAVGAGTNAHIVGYEILQHTGTTDVAIELGTKAVVGGTDTFGRGFFPPGGGISQKYFQPVISGANGTVTFYMGGAGTTWFAVDYYINP